jgi:hypothetical protein
MDRQLESSKCQEKERLKDSEDGMGDIVSRGPVLIVVEIPVRSIWRIACIELFQISTYGVVGVRLEIA